MSVVRQLWSEHDRTQHAKATEEAMCRAREVVGVPAEEWAPLLAIEVHRQVTVDEVRGWECGLGPCPPGDILMAASFLSFLPIHELLGSADHVRKLVALEARMGMLDGRRVR